VHPDAIEHSWFGRPAVDGSRNGYRFDHLFLSTPHVRRLAGCRYRHEPREAGLSDHSAMESTVHM
jgi:exonuclease III